MATVCRHDLGIGPNKRRIPASARPLARTRDEHCWQSLAYSAARLRSVAGARGLRVAVIATDATQAERAALRAAVDAVALDGATLALRFYAPPETNGTVAAALEEQHVCALAAHCLLNERSSFSKRIYLQRRRAVGGSDHSSWW